MRMFKPSFAFLLAMIMVFVAGVFGTPAVQAATTNYAIAIPGVQVVPLQLSGQYTASVTAAVRFALPFKARVIGVSASARASGGTTPTLTVDVLDDGTSILSAPVSVTASAVAEGTVASAVIADESVVTVDLAISGTSPTWNDITVLLTIVRE